jgi:hypothetical protein
VTCSPHAAHVMSMPCSIGTVCFCPSMGNLGALRHTQPLAFFEARVTKKPRAVTLGFRHAHARLTYHD